MAVCLVSERATVQDSLVGCAVQGHNPMLHVPKTSQARLNDLKLDEVGYG